MKVLSINHIVTDPEINNGQPIVAGTVVSVVDIVRKAEYHHFSAEDVALTYQLKVSQVYAALAYYHDHQDEMDIRADKDLDNATLSQSNKRIPNLHPNAMTMSDDFDDPLPLSFWLGDDSE